MTSRLDIIRKALHFDEGLWADIPTDLILMAFRPEGAYLPRTEKDRLQSEYGMSNLEPLEFMGDAVLELAVSQIIFDHNITRPGAMTEYRSDLVRNTALFCFMHKLNLCGLIETTGTYKVKDCADIFEAILGVMYFYMRYIKNEDSFMTYIQEYLEKYYYDAEVINNLVKKNIYPDTCLVAGKTAASVGKQFTVGDSDIKRNLQLTNLSKSLNTVKPIIDEIKPAKVGNGNMSDVSIPDIKVDQDKMTELAKSMVKQKSSAAQLLPVVYHAYGLTLIYLPNISGKGFKIRKVDWGTGMVASDHWVSYSKAAKEEISRLALNDFIKYYTK